MTTTSRSPAAQSRLARRSERPPPACEALQESSHIVTPEGQVAQRVATKSDLNISLISGS
jgi:hypothetical protein